MFHDFTLLETNKVLRKIRDFETRYRSHIGLATPTSLHILEFDRLGSPDYKQVVNTALISIYDLNFETRE